MAKKESVMAIVAHSDDQVLGAGGTLVRYARQGKDVNVIILSYGEQGLPWLQRRYSVSTRVSESFKVAKISGYKAPIFLGLHEGRFRKELAKSTRARAELKALIKQVRPSLIFTHAREDPHKDHQEVNRIVLELLDELKQDSDVYVFDIWNPVNIFERQKPQLYVDITPQMKVKEKALNAFASQSHVIFQLKPLVYAKAILAGLKNDCRYAEKFAKVR